MIKTLASISLFICFTLAYGATEWSYEKEVSLKKDAPFSLWLKEGAKQQRLDIWWTLYQNANLVVLRIFDGVPYQHILTKEYPRNSIKFDVGTTRPLYGPHSYMLVTFSAFDLKKREAKLLLRLYDKSEELKVEIIKKND